MADMTRIKGRIQEVIRPNGVGAITAAEHQSLLLEMVDDINTKKADQSELIATKESLNALEQKVDNLPQGGGDFDAEGNYPLLHVGTADDLAGRGESVPAEFGFRASGGKSIKDGRAYIKRIKGNSVVLNQYCQSAESRTHNGVTFTNNGDGSWTINGTAEGGTALVVISSLLKNKRHKWLITGLEGGSKTTYYAGDGRYINSYNGICDTAEESVDQTNISLRVVAGVSVENLKVYPRIYDLTQMFQAGNEPTTIEEFYARVATLGVDMNAYNEGQVIHCNTESIKSVGDNAWDEEWEIGRYDTTTGEEIMSPTVIRNANYIPILPNVQYYWHIPSLSKDAYGGYALFYDRNKKFISSSAMGGTVYPKVQTPSNAAYMNFYLRQEYGTTYNHDIMITLVHSGWKQDTDAGYQPYWQDILPLPIIRKYFPQGMKSAGTAHDEIRYNKETNRWEAVKRIGEVDMGSLDWFVDAFNNVPTFTSKSITNGASHNYETIGGALIAMYTQMPSFAFLSSEDKVFTFNTRAHAPNTLAVRDSSFTDVASLKAMLQEKQVVLYYELAEPIVTEIAEDFRDYYNVADFGTEQSQSSVPSAPFSADIIYQFNAVDMIREHEIEITELQNVIATMQAQLTSLINGGQ